MIELPDFFSNVLERNGSLHQAVRKTLDLFEPWLEQSGMPFFPGYTDHSPRHITDVLRTAASLISDQSRPLIGPEDVATLCTAILLHDCGMHLTQDGFRSLVTGTIPAIDGLGDLPWSRLWADFLSEASRFNDDKLNAIFGSSDPYRTDQLDLRNLSERDNLLIGEFVRRHHARIAHEIAVNGVPKVANAVPLRIVGLDADLCDISGLVARSHGMSIRNTFQYIKVRYGLIPEYRHIKIPFLMAVLRIADYIQVQSERAIASLLSVKELRSPISRQEWLAHFSVKDVSMRHEDPEALYVHAMPADVRLFVKLDSLFKDIQRELDETWATLGEVYGRLEEMKALGLTIRRVRSNFDSPGAFSQTVPYIPTKARFDSSGPNLLRLLVGPLYNYDYRVGIRELVQNAVDACRELGDIDRDRVAGVSVDNLQVTVEIKESSDGTGSIKVTDQGVGMTLETVTQYFLVAGASFRNSDIWKRLHTDVDGQIRPLRGGRFGIGVLAAFLLGSEIEVTTRHVASSEGLRFKAKIDDPLIELRKCTPATGTSIEIRVTNPEVFDKLRPFPSYEEFPEEHKTIQLPEWDAINWFMESSPRVIYLWDGYETDWRRDDSSGQPRKRYRAEYRPASGGFLMPSLDHADATWSRLSDPAPYRAIYWKYVDNETVHTETLDYETVYNNVVAVNGIRIQALSGYGPSGSDRISIKDEPEDLSLRYQISRPSLAIFDPAALCPLNLQRDSVAFERMGTERRLAEAVVRHHVLALSRLAQSFAGVAGLARLCKELHSFQGVEYSGQVAPVCCTHKGYTLATANFLADLGIETLVFMDGATKDTPLGSSHIGPREAFLLRSRLSGIAAYLEWFRGFWCAALNLGYYGRGLGFPRVRPTAGVWLMKSEHWDSINEKGRVAVYIREPLRSKAMDDQKRTLVWGGDEAAVAALGSRVMALDLETQGQCEIAAWSLGDVQRAPGAMSLLESVWHEVLGSPLLGK